MLVSGASGISEGDLRQAGDRLSRLALDDASRQRLTVEVLRAALDWSMAPTRPANGGTPILGCDLTERSLRFGLEESYRALARLTSDDSRRIQFVDMANAVRPRTWT
jgi:serine/threonine-protein kinase PknG